MPQSTNFVLSNGKLFEREATGPAAKRKKRELFNGKRFSVKETRGKVIILLLFWRIFF